MKVQDTFNLSTHLDMAKKIVPVSLKRCTAQYFVRTHLKMLLLGSSLYNGSCYRLWSNMSHVQPPPYLWSYIHSLIPPPAQYGCCQWCGASSSALFWGAPDRCWHVPAGEWALPLPVAGPGLPPRAGPESLQCALLRPPARWPGEDQNSLTPKLYRGWSVLKPLS